MTKLATFLWFENQAEEAYLSIFKDGRRGESLIPGDVGPWKAGTIATQAFEVGGHHLVAFNGGPGHPFTEAISLTVYCADQAEIDRYWTALQAGGGSEIACGWLKDRFGVRWQIVPHNITELLSHPAAMQAMMNMTRLSIAELEEAAAPTS